MEERCPASGMAENKNRIFNLYIPIFREKYIVHEHGYINVTNYGRHFNEIVQKQYPEPKYAQAGT